MPVLWGVDLGGTKIEGAIIDYDGKLNVKERMRIPTEADQGYAHILTQIKKLIELMEEKTGLKATQIGFSTPGALDPSTQALKNCNTTCLNGQSFKKDVEKILDLPIKMANDANCFALAETQFGAVADLETTPECVFGVIMGTGVGGGVVVNGKVINGRHGIGGEWGHNFVDDSGGDCYCGKRGCNETVFSGPSLQRYYKSISGNSKNMKEIVEAYRGGKDAHATQTMERLYVMFGKAISYIINVLDPEVVVLGGGLANIDELYIHGVEHLKSNIFNNRVVETKFLKPKLGDSAGVFGAALL